MAGRWYGSGDGDGDDDENGGDEANKVHKTATRYSDTPGGRRFKSTVRERPVHG